jgi:hypothetical protein
LSLTLADPRSARASSEGRGLPRAPLAPCRFRGRGSVSQLLILAELGQAPRGAACRGVRCSPALCAAGVSDGAACRGRPCRCAAEAASHSALGADRRVHKRRLDGFTTSGLGGGVGAG